MSAIYLVKRGPKPEYHRAPFHAVIICGKRRVTQWEAGWTGDAAWVWSHERSTSAGGWLLRRWKGFDVDYGHVVRTCPLPDGAASAFEDRRDHEPWTLLGGAIWWDERPMPTWLAAAGVLYPPDKFTQQRILDDVADDGGSGFGREIPSHWTPEAPDAHP